MSCSATKKGLTTSLPTLNSYQFSQLDSLQRADKRPIAVFLHANWCKFCRNMEETTFKNVNIVNTLNDEFHFISFDGEHREDVLFRDNNYKYIPNGKTSGTHELAKALGALNGELVYPSFVLLNSRYEINFQYNAFLNAEEMNAILSHANE